MSANAPASSYRNEPQLVNFAYFGLALSDEHLDEGLSELLLWRVSSVRWRSLGLLHWPSVEGGLDGFDLLSLLENGLLVRV